MCFKEARATKAQEMRRSPAKIDNCIIGEQENIKRIYNLPWLLLYKHDKSA